MNDDRSRLLLEESYAGGLSANNLDFSLMVESSASLFVAFNSYIPVGCSRTHSHRLAHSSIPAGAEHSGRLRRPPGRRPVVTHRLLISSRHPEIGRTRRL